MAGASRVARPQQRKEDVKKLTAGFPRQNCPVARQFLLQADTQSHGSFVFHQLVVPCVLA
jgi:hypothetical protein